VSPSPKQKVERTETEKPQNKKTSEPRSGSR
jgi:hypothetical protein